MNKEEIDKWLDEEYGCSYTRLEELHDFYFEKYCDLKQENQQLNQLLKDKGFIIDKLMEENRQLKGELEKIKQPTIFIDTQDMEERYAEGLYQDYLKEENQSLKKQLEELKSTNKVLSEELTKDKILKQDCLTTCCGIPIGDIPKLINQQKEFIEYLENEIKERNIQMVGYHPTTQILIEQIIETEKMVLSKYKEIIGDNK